MRAAIVICVLMATVGCDATLQRFRKPAESSGENYRSRAMAFEEADELKKALLAWRIAGQLDQDDAAVADRIVHIERRIAGETKTLYQKGLALYRKGASAEARRTFLKILRLNPRHRQARYYLKKRVPYSPESVYKVKAGDSFTKIAMTIYNDPRKAYAIAYFNDHDPRNPLPIGTALIMPDLDTKYLYPRSDIEDLFATARAAYDQKKHDSAIALTTKILAEVPGHEQAKHLMNKARFEYAMELKQRQRYLAALEQLEMVSPRHRGRRQAITTIRRLISQQAVDEKMARASSRLQSGDYQDAVSITEVILAGNPDHAQARALKNEAAYQLGKDLIEQGREAQAIQWLEKVDSQYGDAAMQLSLARSRTKTAAEEHYRNGVKHFINEDLESAIEDWQQALELYPEHPKARQDMENAVRLLEKWQELEKTPREKKAGD